MRLSFTFWLFLYSFYLTLCYADYGNLCRCICRPQQHELHLTILIPSSEGCKSCTSSKCKEYFVEDCSTASEVEVNCINRTAWRSRFMITIFFVVCAILIFWGMLLECFPLLKNKLKKYQLLDEQNYKVKTNRGYNIQQ